MLLGLPFAEKGFETSKVVVQLGDGKTKGYTLAELTSRREESRVQNGEEIGKAGDPASHVLSLK